MRTIGIERFIRSIVLCLCIPTLAAGADSRDPLAVAFGTMPALWGVQISPDGGKIVFLKMHADDIPIAVVFDLARGKSRVVLASEKDRFELSWCEWANEERLLCGYYAIHRDAHDRYSVTRLVAVDADGTDVKVLMQNRLEQSFTQYQDQIVDWLPDDPKHVLIEKPDRGGSGVSKLDVYSGKLRTAERVRSSVYGWMTDGRGDPRLRFLIGDRDYRWQYRLVGEKKWRPLHEWEHADIEEAYQPIGFGDDPNLLLVLKPHQGRIALWSEDLARDREARVVFSHSEVDVGGSLRLGKFRRVVAIGYSTDRNHLHFFDPDIEKITDKIGVLFPGQEVTVADESWDRRFYLVHISSDTSPGSLYRFDTRVNQLALISAQYPKLEGVALSAMTPMRYEARDGTPIPGYLTMPASAPEGPMPAVVLPHGGPQSRDYWSYDWLTQFMSARGYAVLQSNYRGSGGYGEDWSGEGGFRNWRSAIDDVTDGARHLIEAGVADPDRLCIVGWSYGGYAALMSAVEEPLLYRCVVSIAGVSDLPMLAEDSRGLLGWRGAREFIGTDSEVLETGSPARRAAEFRAPVLLLHGEEDINVRFDHSKKMAKALKKKKKDVELIEYEEVAHGIRRNQYRIDMLERIGAFLDENTRSGSRAQ
jgi:dipeptidyl aminopeptidase/acylaminoacyl peptidase